MTKLVINQSREQTNVNVLTGIWSTQASQSTIDLVKILAKNETKTDQYEILIFTGQKFSSLSLLQGLESK